MKSIKPVISTMLILSITVPGYAQVNQNTSSKTSGKMKTADFTTTILVDQSPQQVFNAIINVREWWSENIEGGASQLNDEFSYHYKDIHRCRMKLTEVIPGQKVVWHVMENYFDFTKDKSEWAGTKVIFEISKQGDKTQLRFTHEGLVPEYECYDICSNAWGSYINGSLKSLITTGKGLTSQKEEINKKAMQTKTKA